MFMNIHILRGGNKIGIFNIQNADEWKINHIFATLKELRKFDAEDLFLIEFKGYGTKDIFLEKTET